MAGPILRPIHQAPTEIEAHAIKGYLEENGVHTVVRAQRQDFKGGNVSGEMMPPRNLMPQDICVPKHQMREARILISSYQQHHRKV